MHYDISLIILLPYAIIGAWLAIKSILKIKGN